MRPRILFLALAFLLPVARVAAVADVSLSGPGVAASGESYYVEASSSGSDSGTFSTDLTVYKNGSFFASDFNSAPIAGGWTSDTGAQTVYFDAYAYDEFDGWTNSTSTSVSITVVETWTAFDEPQAWVFGTWSPAPSTVWEDQTFTQTRTNTRVHNTGERSNLGNTRNLGSYTETATESNPNVPGTKPLNPRIVSSSDSWGAWTGSAPAETADNPAWSWGAWSPSPGWYWEDQPATTTAQTRTGSRTVTFTTGSYTQTRAGTHTDNWTNDRGNTWSTISGLSGSQTIAASTRTEAQTTSESQTVADTPRALNPRIVSSSDSWGAWSGSAPAETADNPPWSWGSWSPSPGWYWEDQPATSTTQTHTGTRTVTYTTASYAQTRTGTRTDNWTNDRGDTWTDTSALSDSQTIPSSTRTEAQTTSESQTVPDSPRALNPRHVLSTGAWTDYSAWSPDASTVPSGQTFTQTRTFRRWLTDYWTNDRGDIWSDLSAWENSSESQPATGTQDTTNQAQLNTHRPN